MRYFTHISNSCRTYAKKYGVMSDVQKLAQQIEKQQTIDNLDIHEQFRKKPLGRNFRLILGTRYDGDDCLLILWRVFPRSSDEYNKFCEDPNSFLDKFEQALKKEDLTQIWSNKRTLPDIPQLTDLSQEEGEYLFQQYHHQRDEWMILESEEWVRRTDRKSGEFRSYVASLQPIVYDLLERPQSNQEIVIDNLGVLFHRLPDQKLLFLIAPFRAHQLDDVASLKNRFIKELEEDVNRELLSKRSKRAYPGLVVYDEDLWVHGIQESDDKANLALSDEEVEVLRSGENGYPLFINGRPGSGKSTVLQYLFADHLYNHLTYRKLAQLPLYLTYNKELLDIARENVFRILTSNAYKIIGPSVVDLEEAREAVEHSFVDLRDYLLSLLPAQKRFDERKHIGYPEFRLLFENRFSKDPKNDIRHLSAELAWHVLRTYIKGTVAEENEFLEPEAFLELPSKPQKSITNDTYESVYEIIWSRWYKDLCEKDGHWDDQDLARTVLNMLLAHPDDFQPANHPVVFCDEAQDFTRNELRLIFRLSLFSRRNLTPDVLRRIPFAFAGDPFQTLNPTGFDWGSTRTTFYQTIIEQLDKRQKPTLEFNFIELSSNFRSTRNIVQLCNFIHLIRGIAFGRKDLQPQKTWFDNAANMPVYFEVESPVLQSKLYEQREIVIIVPCQEGEEVSYVQRDEFLKTIALSEDGQHIIRNVLSPMRAKGQEFSRVVIYKFGEACLSDYPELIHLIEPDHSPRELSQEEIIPLEYFINRLYVAASRAERRLFIADTAAGLSQFWKFFEKYDPDMFIDKYREIFKPSNSRPQFDWQVNNLVKIQLGDQSGWEQDHDDPAKLADNFFNSGVRLKDLYLLRLAIQNYQAANLSDGVLKCEGWLYELTGEYERAGDCFETLGNREKALMLYWKAESFFKIVNLGENSLENSVADFMLSPGEKSSQETRSLLEALSNATNGKRIHPDDVWGKVAGTIFKHIIDITPESELPPYEWSNLQKTAQDFFQLGLLSKSEEPILEYLSVRATTYPEKLEILKRIGSEPRIIADYYIQNKQVPLNDTQQEIIHQTLQKLGRFDEAERLLDIYPSLKKHTALLVSYLREKQFHSQIEPFAQKIFLFLTDQGSWEIALDFASKATLPIDDSMADVIKKHSWNNLLHVLFIKVLATSENLPKARKSIKNDISKYLSFQLLDRASAFYTELTISQAGAALERANMIKDCLEFYENVYEKQTWPANVEDIQLAKARWLICKRRQLELQKDNTGKQRVQRDIHKKQEEWKIDPALLPEYPVVDPNEKPKPVKPHRERKSKVLLPVETETNGNGHSKLPSWFKETPPYPDPLPLSPESTYPSSKAVTVLTHLPLDISIAFNGHTYRCNIMREKGKMTICCGSEQEMLTLIAKGLKLRGSDDDFEDGIKQHEHTEQFTHYYISSWDLTCILRQQENFVYATLYQGEHALDLITLRIA